MPEEHYAGEGVAARTPSSRTLAMLRVPDELTTREAAAVLGCSQRIVRRAVVSGALPAVKRGTNYRIPRCYRAESGCSAAVVWRAGGRGWFAGGPHLIAGGREADHRRSFQPYQASRGRSGVERWSDTSGARCPAAGG
jgi:excisionase family DNA binding protein